MIQRKLEKTLDKPRQIVRLIKDIAYRIHEIQLALGRIELRLREPADTDTLQEQELKVFSQGGEDGIIQSLISRVPITNRVFVEFGVQDYTEANTIFLLQNNRWAGLIIDGSPDNIAAIKAGRLYWLYNLKVDCAFIDRENINDILRRNGITGDIGLLSVDIDGNDYWVWETISCATPRIVVCEYNSLFGPKRKVTIPYDKTFVRTNAHFSNVYYGASIAALESLGRSKGYSLVGSNTNGNNAFFVRNDLVGDLPVLTAEQAYVKASFKEARDDKGNLSFLDFDQRLALIASLPLMDIESGTTITVRDLHTQDSGTSHE